MSEDLPEIVVDCIEVGAYDGDEDYISLLIPKWVKAEVGMKWRIRPWVPDDGDADQSSGDT